jgi:hypothetical protein
VLLDVAFRDDLDFFIESVLTYEGNEDIILSPEEHQSWSKIALFKNQEDLSSL